MNRLDRRMRILRGKREAAFNPDQLYLARAHRARAARKIRSLLRRNVPVLLVTPRWSQAPRFLDDLAVDLSVGRPAVQARPLSLHPLQARTVHEAWTWLVHAFTEFCTLPIDGPVATAVSRHGFREVMTSLFRRSVRGPRRALLMHGIEHLPVEARDDLFRAFEEHVDESGDERRINLLIAGSVDAPTFELRGGERVILPDYSTEEAIEALVEYLGPVDRQRLSGVIELVGGVPALVERIGAEGESSGELANDRQRIGRVLGPLMEEVRGAVAIVTAVDGLAARLEAVSREGSLPEDTRWDRMLLRAGIFVPEDEGQARRVRVRARLFADLAQHVR